jgi:hypothetical protein
MVKEDLQGLLLSADGRLIVLRTSIRLPRAGPLASAASRHVRGYGFRTTSNTRRSPERSHRAMHSLGRQLTPERHRLTAGAVIP